MKFAIVLFLISLIIVNADEVERIEYIVKDINKIRSNYIELERTLEDINHQNTLKEKNYKNYINSLENKIKSLKILLKNKENSKKVSKNATLNIPKNQIKLQNCINNQIVKDENKFPDLKMKKKFALKEDN